MTIGELSGDDVAWISGDDMVEVDRIMIDDLGIELIQMMENAGRNLARLVLDSFGPTSVAVLAGSGGNGGGGMVAARHLANAGVDVVLSTTRPGSGFAGVPGHQWKILQAMGVKTVDDPGEADLIVDAIIGYSLAGPPTDRAAELIGHTNTSSAVVVSLDTPSGLDVTSGTAPGAVVRADATLTLALPKVGLRAAQQVGALYLADISVPREVTAAFGKPPPDFSTASILRLTSDS